MEASGTDQELQAFGAILLTVDPSGTIRSIAFGAEAEPLVGRSIFTLFEVEARTLFRRVMRRCAESGAPFEVRSRSVETGVPYRLQFRREGAGPIIRLLAVQEAPSLTGAPSAPDWRVDTTRSDLIGHWRVDWRRRQIVTNQVVTDWNGWERRDLVIPFDEFLEHLYPDDRARILAQANHLRRPGERIEFEYRLNRGDGKLRWILNIGQALEMPDGSPGAEGIAVDITRLRSLESRVSADSSMLDLALRSAEACAWTWNLASGIVEGTGNLHALWDIDPEVTINVDMLFARIHEDDLRRVDDQTRESLFTGRGMSLSFRIRRRDGRIRWAHARSQIVSEAGNPTMMVGVTSDITELREAREQIRHSQPFLALALQAANAGAWDWNLETESTTWTEEYLDVFGHPPGTLPSYDTWMKTIHESDRDAVTQSVTRAILETGTMDCEYRIHHRRLGIRWIRGMGQVRYRAGRPVRMYGVCLDVTREVEAREEMHRVQELLEQRVKERTARLNQINEEMEAFAYSVAHDLRQPLRGISNLSGMMLKQPGNFSAKQREYLERQADLAKRMASLIDDLLRLARVGRSEVRREACDVQSIAREIFEEVASTERPHRVELVVGESLPIVADPALLRIALHNLIENAAKFGKAPVTHIRVEMPSPGRVHVVDDGIGFEMEHSRGLFKPFQRIHGEALPGNGIGLATVHRIVDRHGGTCGFDSVAGEGSTFWIDLPLTITWDSTK